MRQPVVFVSHGSPTLVVDNTPAREFLAGFGARLGRPRAILVVSAHWEARILTVSNALRPETIHDFRGFPPALYALRHPAPGAPEVAAQVAENLRAAGLAVKTAERGLDHGAWVPLKLMKRTAHVPDRCRCSARQAGPDRTCRGSSISRPMRPRLRRRPRLLRSMRSKLPRPRSDPAAPRLGWAFTLPTRTWSSRCDGA